MKKLSLILFCLITTISYSQENVNDAKSLVQAYVSPLGESMGAALNNGWSNTAKPHKLGGFDVTFIMNLAIIPSQSKEFNISEVGGSTFKGGETATILGNKNGGTESTSSINGIEADFDMPNGLNISAIPLPIIQAGIGLIKGTQINARYFPETKLGNGIKVNLFGIGIQHDILQWIPILGSMPIDASIQAGFTTLNTSMDIKDVNSDTGIKSELGVTATTINLLLSKKLLMFTPYAGIGYNSSNMQFNVMGDYEIGGVSIPVADITDFDLDSSQELKANIGFRFNITALALQANYTLSKYPVATIGAGISIR